ncbi:MAG: DUF3579 domain-containing protein [Pigmentiphaga sp.]|nr:DUF3579 domain-containing protein [Pigmentiphaga sp.]
MTESVRQIIIQGVTPSGGKFRPSDWAERLAGVMSPYRPRGMQQNPLTYSPYVVPTFFEGVKSVVVDARLRELEPLAWKFVMEFAIDNNLRTIEACLIEGEAVPVERGA